MMTYLYELLSLGQWELSYMSWMAFCLSAFIVGFAKTGLPGITIVAVPLMAMVLPPKISVGLMLPMYIAADVISVYKYWRFAVWRACFPYLLFTIAGICCAALIVDKVDNKTFGIIIGWTVLTLIFISIATNYVNNRKSRNNLPDGAASSGEGSLPLIITALFGVASGLFSAMANASGPIVTLYMFASRLEKFQFIGTTAVCAILMNCLKVPLFISKGMLNAEVFKLDMAAMPVIALGCVAGFAFAKKLPQRAFKNIILALAFLASVKLILG